jgi:type I restriction enzyme S subunit
MSIWKEYKIGELGDIVTGKTPSSQFPEEFGEYIPFVTPTDYKNYNKWIVSAGRGLSKAGLEKLSNKQLPPKSILVTCIGSDMGKVAINKVPVTTNQQINSIVPNSKVSPDFLFYKILSIYDILRMYGQSGTAVPIVNKGDFERIEIEIPESINEQCVIANILSSLDDKIDLLHRQNKTLEDLAETLFKQWFVEEVDDSWADTSLHAQTEVFRGLSYKGSGLAEEGNGVPMHNLNSVYEGGGYKLDGIKFYNGEYRERHVIKPGEIIVTNTEQGHEHKLIGYPAIVPDYYGDFGLFSQHIYKLKILPDSYLSNEFLYYLLMTYSIREQIIGATNGSTVNMLAIDGLQRPEFKLPPKEKVIEYTEIVKNYWKKKNSNNKQIRTLTGLRDTLLPKLMNGEVKLNSN